MAFSTPDFDAIRQQILADLKNLNPDAAIGPDSDNFVRASGVASSVEGLYLHQQWISRQILPDQSDDDFVSRWASLYGVDRNPAATASGGMLVTGTPGVVYSAGLNAQAPDGTVYVVLADTVVGSGGSVDVPIRAVQPGGSGNQIAGTVLNIASPPSGGAATASVVLLTGGADLETIDSWRARLLYRIQQPPHGGARHDYEAWALEVSGVVSAYIFPLRRGLGTVDVAILANGGLPSDQLISDVQAWIDNLRPVTGDCLVLAPAAVPVPVSAILTLSQGTLADASAQIQPALAAYFGSLSPGDTVYRNRIAAVLAATPNVVDFTLTAPAANVNTIVSDTAVQLATLGAVTFS